MSQSANTPSLSIVLPTYNEGGNLPELLELITRHVKPCVADLEVLVVDTPTDDGSDAIAAEHGARYLPVPGMGFAEAVLTGFKEAKNEWVLTMDADASHHPAIITWLLDARHDADLVIASRYTPRAGQHAPWFRTITSRILNIWLSTVCGIPIKDLSGGFKLYRKTMLDDLDLADQTGFNLQPVITISAWGKGYRIKEIPLFYLPRKEGQSKAAMIKYGLAFLKSSLQLRKRRFEPDFADSLEAHYHTVCPFRRMKARKENKALQDALGDRAPVAACGMGARQIVLGAPAMAIAESDPGARRYLLHEPRDVVAAAPGALPFDDQSKECVLLDATRFGITELDDNVLTDFARVIRPGGRLVVCGEGHDDFRVAASKQDGPFRSVSIGVVSVLERV